VRLGVGQLHLFFCCSISLKIGPYGFLFRLSSDPLGGLEVGGSLFGVAIVFGLLLLHLMPEVVKLGL